VVVDAGHGGVDGGTTGIATGVRESDLNLMIAQELRAYFEGGGLTVVMTRLDEGGLYGTATPGYKRRDMQMRARIIDESTPDLVVSIHLNKYSSSSRSGAQVFFKQSDEYGKRAAALMQGFLNTGVNTRNYSALKGDYYILNCSSYPSVIVEGGFLSNPDDEAKLLTESYRKSLAYYIYCGAIAFLAEQSGQVFEQSV